LLNHNDFVKSMKKAAVEAVEASKPANVVFGTVLSEKPLKIKVDQKLILTEKQLVLARDVTKYVIKLETSVGKSPSPHYTENESGGSGDASFSAHNHKYQGLKTFIVHNQLLAGEEVILMQVAGGQKYVVLDRIGKGELE